MQGGSRYLPLTFLAFSYVSSRASASQRSTERGQHSTDLLSRILASSGSSISTANFQSRTDVGICSRAERERKGGKRGGIQGGMEGRERGREGGTVEMADTAGLRHRCRIGHEWRFTITGWTPECPFQPSSV